MDIANDGHGAEGSGRVGLLGFHQSLAWFPRHARQDVVDSSTARRYSISLHHFIVSPASRLSVLRVLPNSVVAS